MSTFICEKCGYLENTALSNNYYHASNNKHRKSMGEPTIKRFLPAFSYFEDHICCSTCCDGIIYLDGSTLQKGKTDDRYRGKHWSEYGMEKLLEWESAKNGSAINAVEYFNDLKGGSRS